MTRKSKARHQKIRNAYKKATYKAASSFICKRCGSDKYKRKDSCLICKKCGQDHWPSANV